MTTRLLQTLLKELDRTVFGKPIPISAYSINEQYRRFRSIYLTFSGKSETSKEDELRLIQTFNALTKEWVGEREESVRS